MQGTITQVLEDPRLALDCEISNRMESQIQLYLDILVKWNHTINLTAEKDPDSILKTHVFDSLQYSRLLKPDYRVIDIGSGAGFPGIPLKIIFPEMSMVLLESQRKRCSFLETALLEIGLDGIDVINVRAEDTHGQFDAVVFRAVSGLKQCLSLGERFVVPGGRLIVKKPPDVNPIGQESNLSLIDNIAITSYKGLVSSLLTYEKSFT